MAATIATDAAAVKQISDDAYAFAADIVTSDDATITRVTATDGAWKAETTQVAVDTYNYDKLVIEAAQFDADKVSDATRDYINTFDGAEWTFEHTNNDLVLGELLGDYPNGDAAQRSAAWDTELDTQLQARVDWVSAVSGDYQAEISTVSDDKVAWVTRVTNAEAGFIAAGATTADTASETATDAALLLGDALASEESAFEITSAQTSDNSTHTIQGDAATLSHVEASATAADDVAYAEADATYQATEWNDYAAQLQSEVATAQTGPESALLQYYATVAQDEAGQVVVNQSILVHEEQQISAENVVLGDSLENNTVEAADSAADATTTEIETLAPERAAVVDQSNSDKAEAANNLAQPCGQNIHPGR
ncbi:MAG TPA: hypothetical protein VFI31_05830 [Pirellulales bacterium]|nr:hypothetical protein [Pirellulales bacterium]